VGEEFNKKYMWKLYTGMGEKFKVKLEEAA